MSPAAKRAGRRPGESGTREAILTAARGAFAELGYDRATIRGIAAAAEVDPALVLHYYASKEQLFGAALQIPVEPGAVLGHLVAGGPGQADRIGETIVRVFLEAWEPLNSRQPLVAMVRSAMTNDAAQAMVREYLGRRVFGPITEVLGVADGDLRATLVGSQFIGLAMMRYVTLIEPIASASVDQLVAAVGPTVQRYLTGDLGTAPTDAREPEAQAHGDAAARTIA
jgi:AcrR family transcriptional regulator